MYLGHECVAIHDRHAQIQQHNVGPFLFDLAEGAFVLWSLGLLIYGISVVERWRLLRGAVAIALAVLAIFVLTFPFVLAASSS